MKGKIIAIMTCISALCMMLSLASCATDGSYYGAFDKDEMCISVKYECGAGFYADVPDVDIVDVFSKAGNDKDGEGNNIIRLLAPGDKKRGRTASEISTATYTGHSLVGWYKQRSPRVDGEGNPLDENGEKTSVSGLPQGYVYADKWDFNTDYITIESGKKYSSKEYTLVLYAAWMPYFTYTFKAPVYDDSNNIVSWEDIGVKKFNPVVDSSNLKMPAWDNSTGEKKLNDLSLVSSSPSVMNKTFDHAYADADMTTEWTNTSQHHGTINPETATAENSNQDIYTTWKEGTWYRISTPAQLENSGSASGCYEIVADLDFDGYFWPLGISNGVFTGKVIGNGHKISNVTIYNASQTERGGLFGELAEGCEVSGITFDNITYYLRTGSRSVFNTFGLFAGQIDDGALITEISVSGQFNVGMDIVPISRNTYTNYTIGLAVGVNNSSVEIDDDNITFDLEADSRNEYPIMATITNGSVVLAKSDDKTVKTIVINNN